MCRHWKTACVQTPETPAVGNHEANSALTLENSQGVVIPYTAVVTAETGVKKWSRGQAVFSVSVKRSKTSFKLS